MGDIEPIIWAVAAVGLLWGGIYAVHHIEGVGEQARIAVEQKATVAQAKADAATESAANLQEKFNASHLAVQLATPPIAPLSVRICPLGGTVPGPDASELGSAPGAVPPAVESLHTGADIGPFVEQLLEDADAEIAYWQARDAECVHLGLCKAP